MGLFVAGAIELQEGYRMFMMPETLEASFVSLDAVLFSALSLHSHFIFELKPIEAHPSIALTPSYAFSLQALFIWDSGPSDS
jgi:hypothetical protein